MLTVGQATPETTVNDAMQRIENATQRKLAIAMSGGAFDKVLTADEATTYAYFYCAGATAAASLTFPLTVDGNLTAINRLFLVGNANSFVLTVTSTGGADVAVAAGNTSLLFCDGTDITSILAGGTFLTAVSGDAAPSLGGDLNANGHNITTTGDFGIVASSATGGSASIRFSSTGAAPKITVSGTMNVVGTLSVCGATNLGALTVSGSLTVQTLTALQNVVTDGSKVLTTEAAIYDITPFFGGKPTVSGGLMGRMLIGRNISLASGAVGWYAYAGTPGADATKVIDIRKNNASIGSISFASGANTATFTFATTTAFSGSDRLEFYAPATQDSVLSDISIFMKATRTLP